MRPRILPKSEQLRPREEAHTAAPIPDGAWWNGIARKWLVYSEAGPVAVDPQPPPPPAARAHVPAAVKVHL